MAISYIDTSSKEVKTQRSKSSKPTLRLFLKTVLITIAVTFGILLLISLLLGILIYPKATVLAEQIEVASDQADKLRAALDNKDIKQAKVELKKLDVEEKKIREEYEELAFTKYIPILAGYYNDGTHLLNVVDLGLELSQHGIEAITPFADVLGFKTEAVEEITAEEKAKTIVTEVLPGLVPLFDEAEEKIKLIDKELSEIYPDHYPKSLRVKGYSVHEGLTQAKQTVDKFEQALPEVRPLLLAAPEIAGFPEEKTYLVLLQNDKELRATGGFITAYALVKLKNGQIISTESDDIYQLDLRYKRTEIAPEAVRKYIGHNSLPIRDSNISPDFKISAQKFESMYNTIRNVPKVDGVFALDTEFVRLFLEATGPLTTKKTKEVWSAQKNRLGIADVVYKLELHAEKINAGKSDRKGIVGELMDVLIDKIMNSEPDEFPKYLEVMQTAAERKHALFYFHNKTAQSFVEKHNFAGQIHEYGGDYLHLNNSNFGGLKGNLYLKQEVVQDIKIDDSGNVTKTVDVTLKNTARADGWLNSIYLNWMRLYVPEDSLLISKKVTRDFSSGDELGKTVYRGYSATYPLNSTITSFTYRLPFQVQPGEPYKMLIQKQPGVDKVNMTIKINGIEKAKFDLIEDKEVTINY